VVTGVVRTRVSTVVRAPGERVRRTYADYESWPGTFPVANDTGGAVAQRLAATRPERIRSLALTNCETHDNVPPKAFRSTVRLARLGLLHRRGPASSATSRTRAARCSAAATRT
jgi:pimeloyl-ACP methyl ester carboxylesterase